MRYPALVPHIGPLHWAILPPPLHRFPQRSSPPLVPPLLVPRPNGFPHSGPHTVPLTACTSPLLKLILCLSFLTKIPLRSYEETVRPFQNM